MARKWLWLPSGWRDGRTAMADTSALGRGVRIIGAGLAGALIANQSSYVGPGLLHWVQSGTLMIMVILGGVGTFVGVACVA